MKLSALLLLSTFTGSNAFYKSHDIITHDDGSVHLFEKTQHRRLTTKNLKANSDTTNTKFTVHGSEYITMNLHVDGGAVVGGLEFENNVDVFGTKALSSLAGDGITVSGGKLTALALGTSASTALAGDTTTISSGQASAITANTAKTGITSGQASAITANTAKTGITSDQASAITANTAKVSMALGTTSSTALAGDTTTISTDQASAITANTAKVVLTAAANSGLTISGSAISANLASGAIKDALDAVEAADTTTAVQKEYRLERMVLVLCNTLGIKYEHLVRAVDEGSFDPYGRFSAIQVNDDDLYSTDSNSKLVDVTAVSTALCSTYTNYATSCASGYSNRHALTMCASGPCAASDFTASGSCCVPN